MAYDTILLRYGEIFLKGKNRSFFERKLLRNIKALARVRDIKMFQGRLTVDYFSEHVKLRNVFGLTSYSLAVQAEKDPEKIKQKALAMLLGKKGTFRVETKRSDKNFPHISPEFNALIGKHIEAECTGLEFSLKDPNLILSIEINQEGVYLFLETITCHGGLPTGVEGAAILLVEDKASILAGLLFMKRGCSIVPVSFEEKDISLLQRFSPSQLKLKVMSGLSELESLRRKYDISILVSGQHFKQYKKYDTSLLPMRPLISYDSAEIDQRLQEYAA